MIVLRADRPDVFVPASFADLGKKCRGTVDSLRSTSLRRTDRRSYHTIPCGMQGDFEWSMSMQLGRKFEHF